MQLQFSSVTQLCPILCDSMDCSIPGFPIHHRLPEPTQTHTHHVSDAILCCPLLLPPSIFPSIWVFSNEWWPKYWGFSFSISPSNEYSILISFRMDWLDLLAVQGNLKSLLQHHSSKASILQRSAFFIVQLSHPYMTTGKTIAFNFMATVTICSDFGAPKNKVWHCFHCFPIYFSWSDGTRCHDLRLLNDEF